MIEKKVAKQILEDSVTVTLGGERYEAAPPTFATLLRVSELVSELPKVAQGEEVTNEEVIGRLVTAKEYSNIPKILAVLILGEHPRERRGRLTRALSGAGNEVDELAEKIAHRATMGEINESLMLLIQNMGLGDFFIISTFLTGMNVAKSSREVEKTKTTGATARGQSSQG